jgi:hypothetical protein
MTARKEFDYVIEGRSSVLACSGRDGDGAAWPAVISPRILAETRCEHASRRPGSND